MGIGSSEQLRDDSHLVPLEQTAEESTCATAHLCSPQPRQQQQCWKEVSINLGSSGRGRRTRPTWGQPTHDSSDRIGCQNRHLLQDMEVPRCQVCWGEGYGPVGLFDWLLSPCGTPGCGWVHASCMMVWQLQRVHHGKRPYSCAVCHRPVWVPLVCQLEVVAAGLVPRWQARWLLGIQLPPSCCAAGTGAALRRRGDLLGWRQYMLAAAAAAGIAAALLTLAADERTRGGDGGGGRRVGTHLSWLADVLALEGLEGELAGLDAVDTAGFAA